MALKTQAWAPDTHRGVILHLIVDTDDPEAPHVCFEATRDGDLEACAPRTVAKGLKTNARLTGDVVTGDEAQAIFETVLAENRTKNRAEAVVLANLPDYMLRQARNENNEPLWVDKDGRAWEGHLGGPYYIVETGFPGDPVGLKPAMVCREAFRPQWDFGAVDGVVSFTIYGATDDVKDSLASVLNAEFGEAVRVL